LPELVEQLKANTLGSLNPFAPELAICGTIIVLLLVRLFDFLRWLDAFFIALIGTLIALGLAALPGAPEARTEIFTGMLVYDGFAWFIRSFLLAFGVLFIVFTYLSGVPQREDRTDFYALFLGGTLGMCLMATANHMLTVFLAVEMASIPSYVLAGSLRHRRSSEASLKYAVYGAGAAGIMVYGISLVSGITHSAHLPTMAAQLAGMFHAGEVGSGEAMALALGGLMIMVGLAFKLSAVPFHFWAPDVFEGAAAEIGAFLSVASKGAALALLIRVALGLGLVPTGYSVDNIKASSTGKVANTAGDTVSLSGLMNVADETHTPAAVLAEETGALTAATLTADETMTALSPVRNFMAIMIAVIAAITCTFGNLAAYGQTNIKRLLAYSTIAHAGYMMIVPPAIILAQYDPAAGRDAIAALGLYLAVYLFMNLGAFAVVAFLRNHLGSEEIADYAGLIRRCPGVVVCFTAILFSLVGLPPLAGFLGKFAIFASLVDGYRATSAAGAAATYLIVLLVVGGVNTAISLFYYLRVVKVMTIDPEPATRVPINFPLVSLSGAYLALITAPILLLIVSWNWIFELARAAAQQLM
jgi:NADH-quinone oxidoreductase subunit N